MSLLVVPFSFGHPLMRQRRTLFLFTDAIFFNLIKINQRVPNKYIKQQHIELLRIKAFLPRFLPLFVDFSSFIGAKTIYIRRKPLLFVYVSINFG